MSKMQTNIVIGILVFLSTVIIARLLMDAPQGQLEMERQRSEELHRESMKQLFGGD